MALLMIASSCSLFETERHLNDGADQRPSHGMIVLGSQLEDPYSVKYVTKAIESLYPSKAGRVEVEETDLYIRFLPRDQSEFALWESLGVVILDHPLDFEIVRDGDYYQDPDIPDDRITWQYAVVRKDFSAPAGLPYEVLDKCYIAEHASSTKAEFQGIDWAEVEREAFRLSGNESMLEGTKAKGDVSGQPKGRITIVDEEYSPDPVGLAGVMVSCNTFVKFANAYTDENGYYEMTRTFNTEVRYRLKFRNRKGFSLGFNLVLVPSSMSNLGRNTPEGLDYCITKDDDRTLFTRAVVNNAGYDYFEGCVVNGERMTTPPTDLRLWLFQHSASSSSVMLQHGAIVDDSILKKYLGEYMPLVKMFLPDITLGLKGKDSYSSIYRATVHEMAHASHFKEVGTGFWDKFVKFILMSYITSGGVTYGSGTEADHGYCEVGEMWAYYIETRFYRERYADSTAAFGTSYWFSPQILMYLDDRGLDRFKLFKAFTSDIISKDLLQDKLLSMYPENKSMINQAFARYE